MVYLLCFDKKYKHARHYIGFTQNGESGLEKRMRRHKAGQGARLIEVISKAGIGFTLARTWPEGDRNFERKLKNRKKSAELCPLCIERARREKVLANEAKVIEKMNQPPIVCPVVESYTTTQPQPVHALTTLIENVASNPHEAATVAELLMKAKEITNAQSKSDTNSSRWARVRNSLARFWQLLCS